MDDRLRRDLRRAAEELAEKHRSRLEAAGTLMDIEELVVAIGDELSRQLGNVELQRRSDTIASECTHPCPDCGTECPVEADLEPVNLRGLRGEIEYLEPRCHCQRCRRSFFPSGRSIGTPAAREPHTQGSRNGYVGRSEPA